MTLNVSSSKTHDLTFFAFYRWRRFFIAKIWFHFVVYILDFFSRKCIEMILSKESDYLRKAILPGQV